jgi:hypothetical protein
VACNIIILPKGTVEFDEIDKKKETSCC